MPRPSLAVRIAAPLLALAPALAVADSPLDRAESALGRDDGRAAVPLLESALPGAPADDRPRLLDALRRAYELAAQQAEAEGKPDEAEGYRENLAILNRKPGPKPSKAAPAPSPEPAPARVEPAEPAPAIEPAEPAEAPRTAEPKPTPERKPTIERESRPQQTPTHPPGRVAPAAEPAGPEPSPGPSVLERADDAFKARRYGDALTLYTSLAKERRLPENRRDAWAYCRCRAVADRINAGPKDQAEWAAIFAEIEAARRLNPRSWLPTYLRDFANEQAPRGRKSDSPGMVLRGAAPEEPAKSGRTASPRSKKSASPAPAPKRPATAPKPNGGVGRAAPARGEWQILETANFTIFHKDAEMAGRAARVAEATREEQTRKWTGAAPRGGWMPRCDLYLFPTATSYREATKQPDESPGFSTFGLNNGRVFSRELKLRADHPDLLKAVLPHEVTHAVLADLFADVPIPKWADEGMAVLAEPAAEQDRRVAPLAEPLASGKVFRLADLLTMGYPETQYWKLFYAQSVSLTRFLVDRGSPAQFIEFLRASQRGDAEAELRRIYEIDGYAGLWDRWSEHARDARPAEATASAAGDANTRRR